MLNCCHILFGESQSGRFKKKYFAETSSENLAFPEKERISSHPRITRKWLKIWILWTENVWPLKTRTVFYPFFFFYLPSFFVILLYIMVSWCRCWGAVLDNSTSWCSQLTISITCFSKSVYTLTNKQIEFYIWSWLSLQNSRFRLQCLPLWNVDLYE